MDVCEREIAGEYCIENRNTGYRYEFEIIDDKSGELINIIKVGWGHTKCVIIHLDSIKAKRKIRFSGHTLNQSGRDFNWIDEIKFCEKEIKILN